MNLNNKRIAGRLNVISLNGNKTEHLLIIGNNVIGRVDQNQQDIGNVDIPIENGDHKISRRHCIVQINCDENNRMSFLLFDADSTNGTYLEGFANWPLKTHDVVYLRNNDTIIIGETKLIIEIDSNIDIEVIEKKYLANSKPTYLVKRGK